MDKMVSEVMKIMEKNKWKKLLGKKWTYPAIYMIAAALILTLMWWYQDPNEYPITQEELGLQTEESGTVTEEVSMDNFGEAIAVSQPVEKMAWPVESTTDIQVRMEFFDENATEEEMAGAIVRYDNELWPHAGIDIVAADEKPFQVVAALNGEVTRAEKDPVVGYAVELKHNNGLVTHYYSLSDLKVAKGDQVKQGTVLGLASRNAFEKDNGIHLHFEVRKDGQALRPDTFFDQDVNQILQQQEQSTIDSTDQQSEQQADTDAEQDANTEQDSDANQESDQETNEETTQQ